MKRPSPSRIVLDERGELLVVLADQDAERRLGHEVREPATAARTDAAVIIDGHNDLVLRRWRGEPTLHLDLDAARAAGFAGGFFALYVPSPQRPGSDRDRRTRCRCRIRSRTRRRRAIAEELFADAVRAARCARATSADDFRQGRVTAIVHMEGAEPIAPDLSNLEAWYERGLRSIGLVWSRPNAFAEGVPFRFPSSPDTGPGLTDGGPRARARLQPARDPRRPLASERGRLLGRRASSRTRRSSRPTRTRTRCAPSSRNLTDEQLDAIAATRAASSASTSPSRSCARTGSSDRETPIGEIVRHVDYLAERMGVDHVAFGSDFDGAVVPDELGGVAGLPQLVDALRAAGYDDEAVAKITHGNWLRVLGATWQLAGRRAKNPRAFSVITTTPSWLKHLARREDRAALRVRRRRLRRR